MELDDKSLEELEALMADPSSLLEEQPQEAEPGTEAPPPPPPEPPPEPPAEPAGEAPGAEPEPSIQELDRKILEARVEELEAKLTHQVSVAGRNGGEVGFLRKQIRDLESRLAPPSDDSLDAHEEITETPPRPAPKGDKLGAWAVQQATAQAAQQFLAGHPDLEELGGAAALKQALEASGYDAAPVLESNDPIYAAQETSRTLEAAYWELKNRHRTSVRSNLETRRAEQFARIQKAKTIAAPSASGSAPTPAPVAKPMSEWSVEDLDKELRRLTE